MESYSAKSGEADAAQAHTPITDKKAKIRGALRIVATVYALGRYTRAMSQTPIEEQIDTEQCIVVVCGAHLLAERFDRPHADRLRERMERWLIDNDEPGGDSGDGVDQEGGCVGGVEVVICTDLWYLNNTELRARPTLSVGAPGVSALGAYLADKLPTALAVDGVLSVQMDMDFVDIVASCWGSSHAATGRAVDEFIDRYLDEFMKRASARSAAGA